MCLILLRMQSVEIDWLLDVLKAVCLGAKAVGLGRAFLYAQSVSLSFTFQQVNVSTAHQAYGAAGVVKIVQILQREILMCMRLLGARRVDELIPQMVCCSLPHISQKLLMTYFRLSVLIGMPWHRSYNIAEAHRNKHLLGFWISCLAYRCMTSLRASYSHTLSLSYLGIFFRSASSWVAGSESST